MLYQPNSKQLRVRRQMSFYALLLDCLTISLGFCNRHAPSFLDAQSKVWRIRIRLHAVHSIIAMAEALQSDSTCQSYLVPDCTAPIAQTSSPQGTDCSGLNVFSSEVIDGYKSLNRLLPSLFQLKKDLQPSARAQSPVVEHLDVLRACVGAVNTLWTEEIIRDLLTLKKGRRLDKSAV